MTSLSYSGRGFKLYYILTVLLPYIAQRLPTILALLPSSRLSNNQKLRLDLAIEKFTHICRLLDLVHFTLFLCRGGASSLAERLSGLRQVHTQPPELGNE